MRISFFVITLLLLTSCEHIQSFLKPLSSSVFRAVVRGAIKGTTIHCEKSIEVLTDRWEIMCKLDDDTDIEIKYRTIKLGKEETQFEILIDKQKGDIRKTLSSPILLVARGKRSEITAQNSKTHLNFLIERIK